MKTPESWPLGSAPRVDEPSLRRDVERRARRGLRAGAHLRGRLPQFLHQGFNEAEQGRRVFDGVFLEVAGAGRGSFNHRFAQASRDGHQHWNVEPPRLGPVFPALVPAVDPDGKDRAGIRLPEVAVPLASQTGWNWRHPTSGAADALVAYRGSYLPFAWTKAEREAEGDPRLSVEERYLGREDYLGRVALAAVALTRERLLLPQDVPIVVERAAAHWDWRGSTRSAGAAGR